MTCYYFFNLYFLVSLFILSTFVSSLVNKMQYRNVKILRFMCHHEVSFWTVCQEVKIPSDRDLTTLYYNFNIQLFQLVKQ